jgi:hypothetical protein
MAGIFDRLQRKIEENKQGAGISALDLAELPPALRKIMRLMLRELELNYQQLLEAMKALSREERMSRTDLNSALNTLTAQQWLIRVGEGEQAIYKVNLKRRSASSLPTGIWTTLDAKLKDRPR